MNHEIKDDPRAVLRALADGKRLRRDAWEEDEWVRLGASGKLRNDAGLQYHHTDFSGTWIIVPQRDMGADPRVGDRARWVRSATVVVNAVTAEGVMVVFGDSRMGCYSRTTWASHFADGSLIPVALVEEAP